MTDADSMRPQPPEELHWGISYLRQDIQDLRQEIRGTHVRIDAVHKRFDEAAASVDQRFDAIHTRFDQMGASLNQRIDSRFTILLTTMIGLAGVIVAAIKL